MKQLFTKVTVELNTDDIVKINDMILREEPMPVTDKGTYTQCPICKGVLLSTCNYCHHCGQRVDTDTVAL